MTQRQNPELIAIAAILRALEPLKKDEQRRVLSYVAEMTTHKMEFDVGEFLTATSTAFQALNEAAAKISENGERVSGAKLVNVIDAMYREAVERCPSESK